MVRIKWNRDRIPVLSIKSIADEGKRDIGMKLDSWTLKPLQMIEVTGEGRKIMAGQRTIRPVIRARALVGPGDKLLLVQIEPVALIVTGLQEQYAISIDGEPADLESLLDMIS